MSKPRARDLGIPFDDATGPLNAITDVTGVCVGHQQHSDNLNVNTGVTAILPLGNGREGKGADIDTFVLAAWFSLNGCGEMTGTTWIDESGFLEGPIMLTNTASVGRVRDAVIKYSLKYARNRAQSNRAIDPDTFGLYLPVVAETYDGWLNDILGFDGVADMVEPAINAASSTDVQEGNVGGGTGMTCYSWKGGIGTSSRVVTVYGTDKPYKPIGDKPFTVGALVQANQGTYWDLVVCGVPVGAQKDFRPLQSPDYPPGTGPKRRRSKSSIIVVIATDAPLLPGQLKRLARRAAHGIARTGTITNDDSGELAIAFSTTNLEASSEDRLVPVNFIPNDSMDPLFKATVSATEEAIINALVAAETLIGRGGKHKATKILEPANPSLLEIMQAYNRLK